MKESPHRERGVLVASTPLHLLDAILIAAANRDMVWHLFWIDQKPQNRFWYEALSEWEESVFESVHLFENGSRLLWEKIALKRRHIRQLREETKRLSPHKLIVGNDRKNEIAALLSSINRWQRPPVCGYMDDGLHSYLKERSGFWKYTILDDLLKWLVYGYLGSTPKTVGCSQKPEEAYLFRPEMALSCLRTKRLYRLDSGYLQSEAFAALCRRLLAPFAEELKGIEEVDQIFLLPHPKALDSHRLAQVIRLIQKAQKPVAVKLHPRDSETMQKLSAHNIRVLPAAVSAELLFLQMKKGAQVTGFASTVLLTASWLRPDLDVVAISFGKEADGAFGRLMRKNGIGVMDIGTEEK